MHAFQNVEFKISRRGKPHYLVTQTRFKFRFRFHVHFSFFFVTTNKKGYWKTMKNNSRSEEELRKWSETFINIITSSAEYTG